MDHRWTVLLCIITATTTTATATTTSYKYSWLDSLWCLYIVGLVGDRLVASTSTCYPYKEETFGKCNLQWVQKRVPEKMTDRPGPYRPINSASEPTPVRSWPQIQFCLFHFRGEQDTCTYWFLHAVLMRRLCMCECTCVETSWKYFKDFNFKFRLWFLPLWLLDDALCHHWEVPRTRHPAPMSVVHEHDPLVHPSSFESIFIKFLK